MNKIIVISPHSNEEGLVAALTETFGPNVHVSLVDTIEEAQGFNGIAILKHFSKGVETIEDVLAIDTEIVIASYSREEITDKMNILLAEDAGGQDDSDIISKVSTDSWRIFGLHQRYGQAKATGRAKENIHFISTGYNSILGGLQRQTGGSSVVDVWKQDWANETAAHSTNDHDEGTRQEENSSTAELNPTEQSEKTDPVESPAPEQATVQEPETAVQVEQPAEVFVEQEPTPVAEVQPETKTETSQPTPVTTAFDDFDPLAIASSFKTSVDIANASVAEPVAETETVKQPKRREGIPVDYPAVENTVEILSNPLKPLETAGDTTRGFDDWAGSIETMEAVVGVTTQKFNQAEQRGRNPKLTVLEASMIDIQVDAVGSKMMHEFQYVAGANWSQGIKTPTATMPLIVPIKNPNYGDSKYVGSDAVPLIQNRMKIGSTLGVFLPHTGIYFIIVSPTDGELLDTLSVINTQRIETLRASSGILMGNSNYYIYRQVLNLFLSSITNCSFRSWNREQLTELIDERDINIIATALMASVYVDGYEYTQTCGLRLKDDETLTDEERAQNPPDEVCDHRSEFLADLMRTVFIDNSRLNEFQRNIAVSAIHPRSLEEIKDYQQQHYLGYRKSYEITEGIEFIYRAQNIKVSMEAGEKWIGEISQIVDSIITFKNDDEERNMMIDHRINLARIREFSHWVDDIVVDGQSLGDRVKINALLNSLSRNDTVMRKVSETLGEFQRLSMIAITAIPRAKCPTCQKTDTKDLDISKHLIPQDAVSRLFTLVRQRV